MLRASDRSRAVDCTWTRALHYAGWEFERPDSSRVLAFAYTATVGLQLEESCVNINPWLSLEELKMLTLRPLWVEGRPEWLRTKWPSKPVQCVSDLIEYGLTVCKARLAVGAKIADAAHDQMVRDLADLFPECRAIDVDPLRYEAWGAQVVVEADGNSGWGYGGPLIREGLPLPIRDADSDGRSAFDVFLQNQMRIDIQHRIESLSTS